MTSPARTGPGRARRAGRRHGEPLDGRYVDRLAGEHAGGALRVNGDLAVHHHERNADWELARIVIGGSVDDSLGIEHDQVGGVTRARRRRPRKPKRRAGRSVIRWTIASSESPPTSRLRRARNRRKAPYERGCGKRPGGVMSLQTM